MRPVCFRFECDHIISARYPRATNCDIHISFRLCFAIHWNNLKVKVACTCINCRKWKRYRKPFKYSAVGDIKLVAFSMAQWGEPRSESSTWFVPARRPPLILLSLWFSSPKLFSLAQFHMNNRKQINNMRWNISISLCAVHPSKQQLFTSTSANNG